MCSQDLELGRPLVLSIAVIADYPCVVCRAIRWTSCPNDSMILSEWESLQEAEQKPPCKLGTDYHSHIDEADHSSYHDITTVV